MKQAQLAVLGIIAVEVLLLGEFLLFQLLKDHLVNANVGLEDREDGVTFVHAENRLHVELR